MSGLHVRLRQRLQQSGREQLLLLLQQSGREQILLLLRRHDRERIHLLRERGRGRGHDYQKLQ